MRLVLDTVREVRELILSFLLCGLSHTGGYQHSQPTLLIHSEITLILRTFLCYNFI